MKGWKKGQKGFTLVELLIVFTLLGVLAAIVIPNVSGMVGYGQTQSKDAELSVVQTAMDSMMAKENLTAVAATTNTSDMATFPTGHPLYPNYLRKATTSYNYSTTTSGLVSQVP